MHDERLSSLKEAAVGSDQGASHLHLLARTGRLLARKQRRYLRYCPERKTGPRPGARLVFLDCLQVRPVSAR